MPNRVRANSAVADACVVQHHACCQSPVVSGRFDGPNSTSAGACDVQLDTVKCERPHGQSWNTHVINSAVMYVCEGTSSLDHG